MSNASYNVYFGRDPKLSERQGNLWLKQVVRAYLFQYDFGTRSEKAKLLNHIVRMVHMRGGKFLKRELTISNGRCQESSFVEVSFEQARGKVGHLFRDSPASTRTRCWDEIDLDEAASYYRKAALMDESDSSVTQENKNGLTDDEFHEEQVDCDDHVTMITLSSHNTDSRKRVKKMQDAATSTRLPEAKRLPNNATTEYNHLKEHDDTKDEFLGGHQASVCPGRALSFRTMLTPRQQEIIERPGIVEPKPAKAAHPRPSPDHDDDANADSSASRLCWWPPYLSTPRDNYNSSGYTGVVSFDPMAAAPPAPVTPEKESKQMIDTTYHQLGVDDQMTDDDVSYLLQAPILPFVSSEVESSSSCP